MGALSGLASAGIRGAGRALEGVAPRIAGMAVDRIADHFLPAVTHDPDYLPDAALGEPPVLVEAGGAPRAGGRGRVGGGGGIGGLIARGRGMALDLAGDAGSAAGAAAVQGAVGELGAMGARAVGRARDAAGGMLGGVGGMVASAAGGVASAAGGLASAAIEGGTGEQRE